MTRRVQIRDLIELKLRDILRACGDGIRRQAYSSVIFMRCSTGRFLPGISSCLEEGISTYLIAYETGFRDRILYDLIFSVLSFKSQDVLRFRHSQVARQLQPKHEFSFDFPFNFLRIMMTLYFDR